MFVNQAFTDRRTMLTNKKFYELTLHYLFGSAFTARLKVTGNFVDSQTGL